MGNYVLVSDVRLSYVNITEAKSFNGGKAKFSSVLLIPKTAKAEISKIKAAIEDAKKNGIEKYGAKYTNGCRIPIHDGDEKDEESYHGCYYLNASSVNKPKVYDCYAKPAAESEIYSGCYANVIVTFYPYSAPGNKGIGVELGDIQKIHDGDKLGGSAPSGASVFAPIETQNDFDEIGDDDEDPFN